MRRTRKIFWWLLAGPVVVLGAVLLKAYPYFAITRPSGGKVLVIEGWMDPAGLVQAKRLVEDSGYTKVYTTGTIRPFSYYLGPGDGITTKLQDMMHGELEITVSGTTGAGFRLIADGDTLLDTPVPAKPARFTAEAPKTFSTVRVEAWTITMQPCTPEIFIASCDAGGMNLNLLQAVSRFTWPGGNATEAWPTYAGYARAELASLGLPEQRIIAVPAYGKPRSRSWGNAHAFAQRALADSITACDVATMGVHARRSRSLFQTACGPGVRVGVIALHDPFCTRANWWKSFRGWHTLLKEVVGSPEAQAVGITR